MDNNISVEKKLMYHRNTIYKINLLFLSYLLPYLLSIIFTLICFIMFLKSGNADRDSNFVIVCGLICNAAIVGGTVLRLFCLKSFRYVNKFFNITYLLFIVSVILNFVQFLYIAGVEIRESLYRPLVFADSCLVLLIIFFVYKGYQKVLDDNQCVKRNPVLLLIIFQLEVVALRAVGMFEAGYMESFEYTVQPLIDIAFLIVLYRFIKTIVQSSIIVYNIYDDMFERAFAIVAALAIFTGAYVSISAGNDIYVADNQNVVFKEHNELLEFWPENIVEYYSDSVFPGFTLGVEEIGTDDYYGTLTDNCGEIIHIYNSQEDMDKQGYCFGTHESAHDTLITDFSQLAGNKIISEDIIGNDGENEIIYSRNIGSDYYCTELTIYKSEYIGSYIVVNIPEDINETIAAEFSIKCNSLNDGELKYVLSGPDGKEYDLSTDASKSNIKSLDDIEEDVYSGRSFMYVEDGKIYTAIRMGVGTADSKNTENYVYADYIIARLDFYKDTKSLIFTGEYEVMEDSDPELYSTKDINRYTEE